VAHSSKRKLCNVWKKHEIVADAFFVEVRRFQPGVDVLPD